MRLSTAAYLAFLLLAVSCSMGEDKDPPQPEPAIGRTFHNEVTEPDSAAERTSGYSDPIRNVGADSL